MVAQSSSKKALDWRVLVRVSKSIKGWVTRNYDQTWQIFARTSLCLSSIVSLLFRVRTDRISVNFIRVSAGHKQLLLTHEGIERWILARPLADGVQVGSSDFFFVAFLAWNLTGKRWVLIYAAFHCAIVEIAFLTFYVFLSAFALKFKS